MEYLRTFYCCSFAVLENRWKNRQLKRMHAVAAFCFVGIELFEGIGFALMALGELDHWFLIRP